MPRLGLWLQRARRCIRDSLVPVVVVRSPGAVMMVAVGAMVVMMTMGAGAVIRSNIEMNVRSEVVSANADITVEMAERR